MRFPGVGKRIADRMRELGYVRGDGSPDVGRFCRAKGFDPRAVYPWLQGRNPRDANLTRLADVLETTPAWLLHGEAEPGPDPAQLDRRLAEAAARARAALAHVEQDLRELETARAALRRELGPTRRQRRGPRRGA